MDQRHVLARDVDQTQEVSLTYLVSWDDKKTPDVRVDVVVFITKPMPLESEEMPTILSRYQRQANEYGNKPSIFSCQLDILVA